MKTMTTTELKKLTVAELKEIAADLFEADDLKGLKKAHLVELLNDHYTKQAAEDELDDELDDDEVDDEDTAPVADDDELDDDEEPELPEDDELDDEDDDEPRIKIVAETGDTPKTKAAAKTAPPEPSGETLTAKQVATRIGTDAKTLRKFFRSPASTTQAVGQGGRYEFAKEDLPKIQEEFAKWNSTKTTRTARAPKAEKPTRSNTKAVEEVDDEFDEELEIDGPSDDELDDLKLDFDDEEED